MARSNTDHFYTSLPLVRYTLNELLQNAEDFAAIPHDWSIILTDIVGSTEHFKAQRYQEINLTAVSSVSIVLNIAKAKGITVPFVYGGDGATLFVPTSLVAHCQGSLATLRSNVKTRFGMDLRVSIVPVQVVLDAGFSIRVAKLFISSNYHQAVFLGEGVKYAESLMKQAPEYLLSPRTKHKPINLTGLECKWNAIVPPRTGDDIIALIVTPTGNREPEEVFHRVLQEIDHLYGSFTVRHPIHPKTFSPTTHLKTLMHASHLKYGKVKPWYVAKNILKGIWKTVHLYVKLFLHLIKAHTIPDMSTSSDTLKIDNTMKTIFAGDAIIRPRLIEWLDEQEQKGELIYGMHVSTASVMTCYINESAHMHIRFLDGFGGGYTLASIELKKKIKKVK